MNLSKQIKAHRSNLQLSQEELAEKLYVSRQTISNWENEKSYPDIHNLLLLSVLFNVTLDELVKGDVEMMKNELENARMNKWTYLMLGGIIGGAFSIGPLFALWGWSGTIISFILMGLGIYASHKVERIKKKYNLKTYKDILAFQEGRLNEPRSSAKHENLIFQRLMVTFISAIVVGLITYLSLYFLSA